MKKEIEKALLRAGHIFADEAAAEAPERTQNLQNSITVSDPITDGSHNWSIEIFNAPGQMDGEVNYASYVHEGTGLYGPYKKRIRPRKSKSLRIPGIGFRASTKGQKPNRFYDRAWENVADEVTNILSDLNFKLFDGEK